MAKAIERFEPVTMLVRPEDLIEAKELCGPSIKLVEIELDDIWIRDTGPTFVLDERGNLSGIDWNFNGWGKKFPHEQDILVANRLAGILGMPSVQSPLVCEGGAFHVDGVGTLITTESCLLNENRNPGLSMIEAESIFRNLLAVQKVIWLPGTTHDFITDGHVDGICFFASLGVVVVQIPDDPADPEYGIMQENLRALQLASDALGNALQIAKILPPRWKYLQDASDDFAATYVNCYMANGAMIMPLFGDPVRDQEARAVMQRVFPDVEIVALGINAIAELGGGIHCLTLQQPKLASLAEPS